MFKYIDYQFIKDAERFEDIFNSDSNTTPSDFRKCFVNLILDTYSSQINKEARIQRKSNPSGRFVCDKCNYKTNDKSDLNKHNKSEYHNRFILNEKSLCELVGINYNEESDIVLSLKQSTIFSTSLISLSLLLTLWLTKYLNTEMIDTHTLPPKYYTC